MINFQSGDEGSRSDIVIAVINQGHLALKMANVALESFSLLNPDRKEMATILLELMLHSVLVEEDIINLLKAPKCSWRKRIKSIQSHTHETR